MRVGSEYATLSEMTSDWTPGRYVRSRKGLFSMGQTSVIVAYQPRRFVMKHEGFYSLLTLVEYSAEEATSSSPHSSLQKTLPVFLYWNVFLGRNKGDAKLSNV